MTMLALPYTGGFFTDGAAVPVSTSPEVPGVYHCAIGGHGYLIDTKTGQWTHQSIPKLRSTYVEADNNGEKSLNPEALMRVSQSTWHKGAGQTHLDRADSDPARFRSSKGVDVWERWQLSLLPDTTQVRASANTNLRMVTAGGYVYVADGNSVLRTSNLTAYTAVTGTPGAAVTGLASDGYTIYYAHSANGLWMTTRGATTTTQLITGTDTITALDYVKGRLMFAVGRSLYNQTTLTPGALGPALYDHPNTDFTWVGFAAGVGFIYAAGYSGDKSLIYKITIEPDGTSLAVPVQAGELPDGEILRSIDSYLGTVLLGTDNGVRIAVPADNGDLQVGALIETGAVRCFEGQGQYVWFGWENYDSTSTGLGRLDLTVLNDGAAPAYASDLMVTGQGQVLDVATFTDRRVLAVSGLGFYQEDTSLVSEGTIDSGLISYDLPDNKTALYLDVKHKEPLSGTHTSYLSADDGAFVAVGQHGSGSSEGPFTLPELGAETFEIREILERDSGDTTLGPVLRRHTLLSNPQVDTGYFIVVPLLIEADENTARSRDPQAELEYLKALRADGSRTVYQEWKASYSVTVDDLEWHPNRITDKGPQGTCLVKLKTI